jgi:hypothetical protein
VGSLLQLSEEEHVVLLTMHHIISDGWSIGLVINEVGTLYKAFLEGNPSPLEDLPIQYADYAYWQQEHLSGETLETHLSYWRHQLAGATGLELPPDKRRPADQTTSGAGESFSLAELSEQLRCYVAAKMSRCSCCCWRRLMPCFIHTQTTRPHYYSHCESQPR